MFILNNLSCVKPLTIKKINQRCILELDDPPIVQHANERLTEDKILLVDTDEKHNLKNIRNAEYCAFFDLTTKIVQEDIGDIKSLSYDELSILHGSKYARKAIDKRDVLENDINVDRINLEKYAGSEQIVPTFNTNAKNAKSIYKLSIMFDKKLVREVNHLELNCKSIRIVDYKYRDSFKAHFIILDTILYVLEKNYVPERLPYGDIMYDVLNTVLSTREQNANIERNKYRRYGNNERFKFIAMACVILLIIHRYEIDIGNMPNFGISDAEITKIMRLLGCKCDKNKFKLARVPETKVRVRRGFR